MAAKPKKKDVARKDAGKIICGSGMEADLLAAGVKKQDLGKVLQVFKSSVSRAAGSPSGAAAQASS